MNKLHIYCLVGFKHKITYYFYIQGPTVPLLGNFHLGKLGAILKNFCFMQGTSTLVTLKAMNLVLFDQDQFPFFKFD